MGYKTYLNMGRLYLASRSKFNAILPKKVHPLRASIRLTENCNSRCVTCNYWGKKWEDRISTRDAVDIIHNLGELGVERVRFTGGETFLRRDFFDIVSAVKEGAFKKITVATNGLLLKKYADEINRSCITDLGVSIDGMAETNDMMRGVRGYFSTVFEGIRQIKKNVTIMTTLSQKNAYELEELFRVCEDHGVLWDFNLLDNRLYFLRGKELEEVWPDEKAVDHIVYAIRKNLKGPVMKRISELQLGYTERYLKKQRIEEPPCYLGYTDIAIDSQGSLWTGCYVLPPVGNVLKDKMSDLFESQKYVRRLEQMRGRQCPGCTCGYEINVSIEKLPRKVFELAVKRKKK